MSRALSWAVLSFLIVASATASAQDAPDQPPFDQAAEQRILAWLRDEAVRFTEATQFRIDEVVIDATPVDVDGDGDAEWLLVIDSPDYWGFWLLDEDSTTPSGYRRLTMPAPLVFSSTCDFRSTCGGRGALQGILDVTGDGAPELLISRGSCGYGICGAHLHILSWRDGALHDGIAEIWADQPFWYIVSGGGGVPAAPPEGTWTFENRDADRALELTQGGFIIGSMDCTFEQWRTFDWDAAKGYFVPGDETFRYDESIGCAIRQAHLALKDSDYARAIGHYERALAVMPADASVERGQYARLRLASAYALTGQHDAALRLLDGLAAETPASTLIDSMLAAAQTAYLPTQSAVDFCAALYTTFDAYDLWGSDSAILEFAQINDYGVPLTYGGGDISADNAGCNLKGLLAAHAQGIASDSHPLPVLRAQGWQIRAARRPDLNADGRDDWQIWTPPLGDWALELIATEDAYVVGFSYRRPPARLARPVQPR